MIYCCLCCYLELIEIVFLVWLGFSVMCCYCYGEFLGILHILVFFILIICFWCGVWCWRKYDVHEIRIKKIEKKIIEESLQYNQDFNQSSTSNEMAKNAKKLVHNIPLSFDIIFASTKFLFPF